MAFIRPEQSVIEAEGFTTGSKYSDANDVYSNIVQVIEDFSAYDVKGEKPSYFYERKTYKITIKVELL